MSGRLDRFFAEQAGELCHVDYWGALAGIWRDGDERADERWTSVWEQARLAPGAQDGLMTAEEQAALAALPERVGLREEPSAPGLAWRVDDGPSPAAAAGRHRLVALFLRDGEPEVVALPADVERA